jgi:uncharacterized membrane protein
MIKTLTFALVHFTVAFTVAYALSGSLVIGGAIALVEPIINTIAYFFHEKIWERIRPTARRWRRACPPETRP